MLVRFDSWPALLAFAATGAPLYYQAPMNVSPTRLTCRAAGSRMNSFEYKVTARPKAIRIKPGPDGDMFTADQDHLARFLRPADIATDASATIVIPRDHTYEQIGREIFAREGSPRTGYNVREICLRYVRQSAIKRGHNVGVCETSLECSRCGDSCAVNPAEQTVSGRLAVSDCSKSV